MENPAAPFRFIKRSRRKKSLLILVLVFLLACGNNETEGEKTEVHSIKLEDPELAEDLFPEITFFFRGQDPGFDSSSGYLLSGEGSLEVYPATPIDDHQIKDFMPILIFNSDRTKAIDMYSGSWVAVNKNGTIRFESGEPDTEVAVIDFPNKSRTRIFYTGPSFIVQEVRWLNDSVVAIAGALQVTTGKVKPQINKIFLNENRQEIYEFTDTINARLNDYQEQRIKEKLGRK